MNVAWKNEGGDGGTRCASRGVTWEIKAKEGTGRSGARNQHYIRA